MRSVWRHEYSAALARFRRSIREARDEFERECRSACSRGNVYSKTFREAFGRTRPPRLLPPLERPDGTYTTTHLESAALLLRSQIAVDDAREDLPEHAAVRSLAEEPYGPDNDDVPFTEAEVRAVLAGMPSRSSPGPDEITPRLMRGLFDAHTTFVMHVFNSALRLGHFPRCWRRGRIIFLPKPDRPPQRTTSYRPICVNSIFGKVLERLLNGRLYHFMWRNGHVHANQFGFTHGRSAVSALVRLKERLAELKAARTPAVMMALDFQGAFDSVWHPGVLRFFRERRVPANLYHLLRTFLRDRSVVFISHAGEIEAHPSLGSPQGSPLSPMLWNVTIHDLLDLPLPTGITLQAYADDTVIVVPAQNRDALAELGSRVLGQVIGWAAAARVVVSREKTFCLLFSNGHRGMEKNRPPIRVTSGDRGLAYKDAIRVLGVVFDGRLSFFKHADHLREKAEVTVAKIAALAQMQGGRLRPEQKTSLYRSVFLPGVMYASPVWWDRTRPDCRLRSRLASIQRAAMLALLGAYRTTRTAALQVLLNAPPIALELERANAEYDLVVKRTPVLFGDISFTPDEIMPPVDVWQDHPAARMYYGYCRLTRDGARRLARAPGLHVYTDGSYTDRTAGAAFVMLGPGDRVAATGRYRVERATSAYCAEVTAMIEALHYIRDTRVTADVRIYTDSLSLLQTLSRDRTADGRVYAIKTALRDIAARAKIWLYHVPGHSGVFGNELADFLASRAAVRGQARRTLLTPRAVRAALRRQERLRWAREWTENSADTYLYRWVPRVSEVPAWFPPNRALVTLLTGHGRFVSYFHRFNLIRDPHCACGQVCDGVDHYIFQCPITRHLTGRLQTREDFDNKRYEALLVRPQNRALLIRLVRVVSQSIPDVG